MTYRAVVDGSEVEGLDQFAGQPLYFVVEQEALQEGRVRVFYRLDEFKQELR